MKLRYFQHGFNYSQDGPGNRLVYHLKGCNMFCPWCSNPEGMSASGDCSEADAEEIVREIISCKPMFFDGGGVTFTGGEASLQLDALSYIMAKVKDEGISTAIETNATLPSLSSLRDFCDYWMIDYKHPDKSTLKAVTGGNLDIIEENIKKISKFKTVHIRIPLIHGFNDDLNTQKGFSDFFASLKAIGSDFDIELLCYHEYGREKWKKIGAEYKITDGFVPFSTLENFTQLLKSNGFTVIKT